MSYVLILILLSVFLLFAAILFNIKLYLFKNYRNVRTLPKYEPKLIDSDDFSRSNIKITLSDGTKIAAYNYKPKPNTNYKGKTIVILHGFRSTALNHIDVKLATSLAKSGYQIFSYDVRGHGNSTDNLYCDFKPEYYYKAMVDDSKEIMDFIKLQHDVDSAKLAVIGFSYGGSISLTGMLLDKDVKLIFAGCAIYDYNELWRYHLKHTAFMLKWATKQIFFQNRRYKKYIEAFDSISPVNFADKCTDKYGIKTLHLLHCKDDPIVPYEISFSKNLKAFNVKSENTLVFEDGGHEFKKHHAEVIDKLLYWLNKGF